MSNILTKLFTWFILLVVIIAVVTSVRTEVMAGGAAYDVFIALFSDFPFAQLMAEIVSTLLQYNITLQGLSAGNVITDLSKLFGMTLICPLAVGIATAILLPVPAYDDWKDREDYMSTPGYRIKEALVHVITMPVCAWLAAKLVDFVQQWLVARLPIVSPIVVSFTLLIVFIALSMMVTWIRTGFSFSTVFRHRLLDDLLGNVMKILGLNLACFAIGLGIINDQGGVVMWTVVLLFIYLAGISLMLDAIRGTFS